MRVFNGVGRFGAAQEEQLVVQTNQAAAPMVEMLKNAIMRLAAQHQSDMTKMAQALNTLSANVAAVNAQNVALKNALQAAMAGVRVGYGPSPAVPTFPGQAVGVGVPTHALRAEDIDIVDGGADAPRATVDPMAATNSRARAQAYEDYVMHSGGEDDDE